MTWRERNGGQVSWRVNKGREYRWGEPSSESARFNYIFWLLHSAHIVKHKQRHPHLSTTLQILCECSHSAGFIQSAVLPLCSTCVGVSKPCPWSKRHTDPQLAHTEQRSREQLNQVAMSQPCSDIGWGLHTTAPEADAQVWEWGLHPVCDQD